MKFQQKEFFPLNLYPFLVLIKFIYGPLSHATPALGSYESFAICVVLS